MLRNKYFIIAVGIMLVLTAGYNVVFFKNLGAKRSYERAVPAVSEGGPAFVTNKSLTPDKSGWKRNPFGVSKVKDYQKPEYRDLKGGIKVEAISFSGNKGHAVVNGKILGVGDSINGLVITGISPHSITVKEGGKSREIPIY